MTGYTPIYNLPYPQASDLVSAYPGTGQDLAEEVETVLAAKAALASPDFTGDIGLTGATPVITMLDSNVANAFTQLTGSDGILGLYADPSNVVIDSRIEMWVDNTLRMSIAASGLITGSGTSLGAWTAYTPTVTSGSGTFTTVSGSGLYCQIGKTVIGVVNIAITTNGTAATSVVFTLPVTRGATVYSIGSGRAGVVSGKQLQVQVHSTTQGAIYNYDNTYPGANGESLRVHFIYEAA